PVRRTTPGGGCVACSWLRRVLGTATLCYLPKCRPPAIPRGSPGLCACHPRPVNGYNFGSSRFSVGEFYPPTSFRPRKICGKRAFLRLKNLSRSVDGHSSTPA